MRTSGGSAGAQARPWEEEISDLKTRVFSLVALNDMPAEDWPMAVSLQGLANREGPNVYLVPRSDSPEKHWVEWYRPYGCEPVDTKLDDLLQSLAARVEGFIAYEPSVPDSLNVAISLAGVMGGVVCSPVQAERARSLGLRCLADLRGMFQGRIEPYRWLIDQHLSRFDLRVMANYNQTEKPRVIADMDYLVAHHGFCMGLSINSADHPEEAELWERVQEAAPSRSMMIGWHTPRDSEATHVYFASRHSVWLYCGHAWNTSFHQHIQASGEYSQDHCPSAVCEPGARYATITLSDGDSWHSMADVQKKFWLHPRRGEVPLGWEVAPVFAEVGPALLEYYYRTRTENDYLVSGPSGIGYNYLSGFADWQDYLEISAEMMRRTSLKTIWAINRVVRHVPGGGIEHRLRDETVVYSRQQMEEFGGIKDQKGADLVDPEVIEHYMKYMPDALGFFQGWERIPGENPHWCDGRLWSPAGALVRKDIDGAIREFEEAAARQPLPAFVSAHVNCYDSDMEVVIETVRRLERLGFTVVRPDVFLRLAQDAYEKGLAGGSSAGVAVAQAVPSP